MQITQEKCRRRKEGVDAHTVPDPRYVRLFKLSAGYHQ